MVEIQKTERMLTTNNSTRNRGASIWLVPVEDALLRTNLVNDLIPLPYLEPGLNLVQKPPSIGYDIIRRIRILIGDDDDPYYFTNLDITEFYLMENCDLEQAAAMACETWASRLSYNEGNYSAQGITVNSSATAGDKRQRAAELRMRMTYTATPRYRR